MDLKVGDKVRVVEQGAITYSATIMEIDGDVYLLDIAGSRYYFHKDYLELIYQSPHYLELIEEN